MLDVKVRDKILNREIVGISQDRSVDFFEYWKQIIADLSTFCFIRTNPDDINRVFMDYRYKPAINAIENNPSEAASILTEKFGSSFTRSLAIRFLEGIMIHLEDYVSEINKGILPDNLNSNLSNDITLTLSDYNNGGWGMPIAYLLRFSFCFDNGTMKWQHPSAYLAAGFKDHIDSKFFREKYKQQNRVFHKLVELGVEYAKNELGIQVKNVDLTGCPFEKQYCDILKLDDLIENLIKYDVKPIDAEVIAGNFEDVIEGRPTGVKSKNVVYYITDVYGNNKVIKFVKNKKEADAECFANYNFSQHPVLRKYVPKGFTEIPIKLQFGSDIRYVTIQENVNYKTGVRLNNLLKNGSKEQLIEYVEEWMRNLAAIHFYGTEVANKLNKYSSALRLTKEKDESRVKVVNHDFNLRADIRAERLEDMLKPNGDFSNAEARIGKYAIDWGHSGRGNPILDVARVLLDVDIKKKLHLDDNGHKHFINIYLKNKDNFKGKITSAFDINNAFFEFRKIGLLYMQSQAAYLISRGNDCSEKERETISYMEGEILRLEKGFSACNGSIVREEKNDCIVYTLPDISDIMMAA